MIERIADNGIFGTEYGLEKATVCIETRRIKDGLLGTEEVAETLFELFVQGLSATNETHRGHAVAVLVERFVCSLDYLRMVCETEVIVCAQVDDLPGVAITPNADFSLLRTLDQTLRFEQPLLFESFGLLSENFQESFWHCVLSLYKTPIKYSKMQLAEV